MASPTPLVLIPSRLAATRLPDKPLADIGGEPMIVHVWRRAVEAKIGDVVVATDSDQVAQAIRDVGGQAVLTRDDHPSGSDRIYEALQICDPDRKHDIVVNLQGDLPTLDPASIKACLLPMEDSAVDIATLGAVIRDESEISNPSVVKIIGSPLSENRLRGLYFTRATAPHGEGPLYHHIGIYTYRRAALERFVSLSPSYLERREKLEQLRAIEDGMRIDAMIVDTVPLGVDTPHDLTLARQSLA